MSRLRAAAVVNSRLPRMHINLGLSLKPSVTSRVSFTRSVSIIIHNVRCGRGDFDSTVACRQGTSGVWRRDAYRRVSPHSLPDDQLRHPCRTSSPASADSERSDEESSVAKEVLWRICDCWLFDSDDEPSVRPDGPDETDRIGIVVLYLYHYSMDTIRGPLFTASIVR